MSGTGRTASREEIAAPLHRAARELRRMTVLVESLEQAVGLTLDRLAGAPELHEFQKLDQITQNILGVADFLDALSQSASPAWRLDAHAAARFVALAALGARLGDPNRAAKPAPPVETYELF